MPASVRRALVALSAAALLGGCALAPKLSAPRLSIVDVQVVGGGLWEQRLKVRLRVENPNDRALPVQGLECTMEVEGEQFGSGVSAASFVVPALGEAQFDMNVTTNVAGTLLKLLGSSADARSHIAYHLTGKVSLSSGLWRSIPFDERGTFSLQ